MPIQIPNIGRDDLARLFAELGFRVGAEIGIKQGIYSEILCQANSDLLLHCIDPWKSYEGWGAWYNSQLKIDEFYKEAQERLAYYNCRLIKKFSMEAIHDFADESLDFVFIDANHDFLHIAQDIDGWRKKVRKGGIVSGHDYIKHPQPTATHVAHVVNAYTSAYSITPWFLIGSKAKIPGEVRDKARSWMWVK